MIISIDTAIAFAIMLIMMLLFASALSEKTFNAANQTELFELEEKAAFLADTLVKNHNEQNPSLGAAIIDTDKKRTLTNKLSMQELLNSKPLEIGEYFLSEITITTPSTEKTVYLTPAPDKDCINVKRFVLAGEEKGILRAKTCKK